MTREQNKYTSKSTSLKKTSLKIKYKRVWINCNIHNKLNHFTTFNSLNFLTKYFMINLEVRNKIQKKRQNSHTVYLVTCTNLILFKRDEISKVNAPLGHRNQDMQNLGALRWDGTWTLSGQWGNGSIWLCSPRVVLYIMNRSNTSHVEFIKGSQNSHRGLCTSQYEGMLW